MEETDNRENELHTVDGTFVDDVIDTLEVPEMTEQEADDNKEQEQITIEEEGGK